MKKLVHRLICAIWGHQAFTPYAERCCWCGSFLPEGWPNGATSKPDNPT